MNPEHAPLIEMKNIEKHFGSVIALNGVSLEIYPGECHCLLGDNGAGKSTFIKTMSGVHKPTRGEILFEGKPMHFEDPRDAITAGIATVYQDLAMIPLMSVSRNFFMGNEPEKRFGRSSCSTMTTPTSHHAGDAQDGDQPARTRPGGGHALGRRAPDRGDCKGGAFRRQGADPRRADLGARRAPDRKRAGHHRQGAQDGIAVVFITHNVRHALAVGDRFTVLNRGKTLGTAQRGQITPDELQDLMAGGQEMVALESSLGGTV
jgi:simple sugar transport system ATP-binding protein